uniref:Uncharacterized protein n=1 Tax=Zea mays TaxID=4577 RepID=C4IYF4_MAIZE|nr:unknown [Zea mays]
MLYLFDRSWARGKLSKNLEDENTHCVVSVARMQVHFVSASWSWICIRSRLTLHVGGVLLFATAARDEGHELEHDVHGVLRRDVEERGCLVADGGAAAGEVGEGADGDEGDAVLVRDEGHGGALHLHGGAPEVGADELAVAGVVGVDVGAAAPGHPRHPGRAGQARRRVHARRQLQPLQLPGERVVALVHGHQNACCRSSGVPEMGKISSGWYHTLLSVFAASSGLPASCPTV